MQLRRPGPGTRHAWGGAEHDGCHAGRARPSSQDVEGPRSRVANPCAWDVPWDVPWVSARRLGAAERRGVQAIAIEPAADLDAVLAQGPGHGADVPAVVVEQPAQLLAPAPVLVV